MNAMLPNTEKRNRDAAKRRGAILMIFALVAAPLLLMTGLVLDGGMMYFQKRRMQAAADAGAWAGALEVLRGNDSTVTDGARDDTSLNGFTHDGVEVKVTVNRPPASGPASTNPDAVEVIIEQTAPISLMPILLGEDPIVRARAVAAVEPDLTPTCMLALNETAPSAILFGGTADVIAPSCKVQANSNDPQAIRANGSITVTTAGLGYGSLTGNYVQNGGSGTLSPTPTGVPYTADPFAQCIEPTVPVSGTTLGNVNSDMTLTPGYYPGDVKVNGGTITFMPGLYIFDGFTATGGSLICPACVGDLGVTIFNTGSGPNANIEITGNVYVDLKAPIDRSDPTDDQYGCGSFLFWNSKYARISNPRNAAMDITGTSDSYFEGNIYGSTIPIRWGGNANTPATEVYTMIVGDTLQFQGTPTLGISWEATGRPAPVRTVAMVE